LAPVGNDAPQIDRIDRIVQLEKASVVGGREPAQAR
jgi:hypothetical protein